jgi:hypothetical protein
MVRVLSQGGGLMTQQYSWPGPLPPGRRGTIRLIRCVQCKGALHHTKAKGRPRQEDHEQGCEAFIRAIRIMQYTDELNRAASGSAQGGWLSGRRRRKYLRENAKLLTVTACEPDPAAAVSALGDLYQAECQARGQPADTTQLTEMLMRACRQLARGQAPAPVVTGPR